MIEVVKRILHENDLCVLATTDGDRPHASLMSYIADDEYRHLYLVTSRDTRKFTNITTNPNVSLLIDDRHIYPPPDRGRITSVIFQGTAEPVDDPERAKGLLGRFSKLRPHLSEIVNDPSAVVVEVFVHSIQLLDGVSKSQFHEFT